MEDIEISSDNINKVHLISDNTGLRKTYDVDKIEKVEENKNRNLKIYKSDGDEIYLGMHWSIEKVE